MMMTTTALTRATTACLLVGACLGGPAALAEEDPGVSLAGSGLLVLPGTSTLAPGRFTLALTLDNKDRDPLGLDLFDYSVVGAVGLASRLEAHARVVPSRVVALPERPPLPPPPLDIVAVGGAAVPPEPHYALHRPVPYVRRSGRFERFVPGDATAGLKLRVADADGFRPAVALGAEIKVPLTRSLEDLQQGAGTGGADLTGRLVLEWRLRESTLVAGAAYTRVGAPAFGNRTLRADGGGADVVESPFRLPDRLDVGVGARHPVGRRVALLLEAAGAFDAGDATPVIDARAPVDILGGVQAAWGGLRLTAALRRHGHALPSGALRAAPLAGFVDVTDVGAGDLAAYLDALGAGAVRPHLEPGRNVLVTAPGSAVPLPAGARRIPDTYTVRSEHQWGFALVLGWAF